MRLHKSKRRGIKENDQLHITKTNKKISIIHAKSAKKIDNQDHLQERSKNQNRKLNCSHKTKNDKQRFVVQNIKSKQEKHSTKEGSKIL